ncbi:cytochrome P450 [Rhodococcus sp. BP-349]|uniref:cytochrome P450 n=1 Tax=unclassified Rhodococcus (in: high G+C Gram-positive bacteria) TaxID=192944 RepID=UPI001C9B6567|nr:MULTISPECIES: cytochrome P450 [unclassified Rhodococcus (in: high G+C Gram-positive bacteria)]MBY6537471.1 cytochrome P450 [Rhodococcus sp. BP-363]MBY6541808.1 cytochrome P450 [Rhodococcus sp. BP-369]MBY6561038.1 cytochrome P450 [Rhodococcus sp. BP-370]MBY6575330.1 cytochrome P450 [Rhodococcus sp. BP-364]MBY6584631.1 cytochrome P450 [Rhodococcus sp. BP-358]
MSDTSTDDRPAVAPAVTGPRALAYAARLMGPSITSGVILRRPAAMALAEKVDADAATLAAMRELRLRYGSAPVHLALPGRTIAVVLDPADVRRILVDSPEDFTAANREKIGALGPFQPHGVLISRGRVRDERRAFNEQVLDTPQPLHHLASAFVAVVDEEVDTLLSGPRAGALSGPGAGALSGPGAGAPRSVSADEFLQLWWRVVRRVVLGASARDDETVTDRLRSLRRNGNWSYFIPPRRRARDRFIEDLYSYVDAAEPNSLAAVVAHSRVGGAVDPVGQMPQWLFAFDAAGMATLRALALLASHPDLERRAVEEASAGDVGRPQALPFLRACILESLRLWPTTPAILRDSTVDTEWESSSSTRVVRAGTAFAILASGFHRDADALPFADRFSPDIWLDGTAEQYPQLVPFSAGPVVCPGQNLVLFTASSMLASILARSGVALTNPALAPSRPLPPTLNTYGVELSLEPRT